MAMKDLYNKTDIHVFDFIVYIKEGVVDTDAINEFKNITNSSTLDTFLSSKGFFKLGKLDRALSYSTEDGDTITDNECSENIITKTGSINAEHIAVNNSIVRQMRALDGSDISVIFVSKKNKKYHNLLFPSVRYDYEETETSGNVQRLPFSVSKSIDSVSTFRIVNEFTES